MKYLLDSVILIDHFNNIDAATQFLKKNAQDCVVSVITRAEVLTGFEPSHQRLAKIFLDHFETLSLHTQEADLAATLRQQEGWKLPDAIQAALAKTHRLKLITRNTRDFNPTKYEFVIVPYALTKT